jgi:hypothetical protein
MLCSQSSRGIITLTKHPQDIDKAAPEGDGAPDIKITDAMIDAGIDAYLALDREWDLPERIVRDIFEAMLQASLNPPPTTEAALSRRSVRQSHWW